ncbi:MAG: STAS domain-containing protein [Brevinematia bacterium]
MEIREQNGVFIVKPSGVMNVQYSMEVENKLDFFFNKNAPKKVIVDFSEVQHISSSGLRVLVSFYKKVVENEGKMFLVNLNSNLKKIFKIVELDTVFQIFDSFEEAFQKISNA